MSKKKLLLINPVSGKIKMKLNFVPPVSLGVLAALTPDNWSVEIVDENIEQLAHYDYDLVGITTSTLLINRAYELAELFKQRTVPVVMGGCHASAMPDEALQYAEAVVVGDAENVWKNLLEDAEKGTLKKIYSDFETPVKFSIPNTSFFKKKYFLNAIETSRGCYNNCSYCATRLYRKKYIRKPVEMVVEEMKQSEGKFIFFIDNNFYGNDDAYMVELFEAVIKNKIKKIWQAGVTVDFFKNKALTKLASKSGARMLFVGFEADTKKALNDINKNYIFDADTLFEKYKDIIKTCHKNKILVISNIMIGLENDTREKIIRRIDFFKKLNADISSCVILTPFPGTHIYRKMEAEKRLLFTDFPCNWAKYHYTNSLFKHKNLTKGEIETLGQIGRDAFKQSFFKLLKAFSITQSEEALKLYYYYCLHFANYKNSFADIFLKNKY